jgi:acyl-coenzyme A thioesterase PaaI-like protein
MTMAEKTFQDLPNRFRNRCFACSPDNMEGLRMTFQTDGRETVRSQLVVPERFSGWRSVMHGGIAATILDEVMSWTVIHLRQCLVMTKSLSTEFLQPISVGECITATGQIVATREKREVIVQGFIYNARQEVCVKAQGVFLQFSSRVGKRMGVIDNGDDPFLDEPKATI